MSLESRSKRLAAGPSDEAAGADLTPSATALSITDLFASVDRSVRSTFPEGLWITGEIRSLKVNANGHCFIDLVDPSNSQGSGAPQLSVKCWSNRWRVVRTTLERLGITLDAGMVVRAKGEVGFYKARGTVDFTLSELDTDALMGRVAAERAKLIQALIDENLFDRQRRLRTVALPLRVGLVASPGTEGYNDFLGGLSGSGLAFVVTVAPTAVQGKDAPPMIASAIGDLQSQPVDVIVLVRGGGSKADLAAYDQEPVARAVANSAVPVWTGIGHTGDLSVADEVANRAFITPTECGQELARLALAYWEGVEEACAVLARVTRERLQRSDAAIAAHRRALSTGARNQLDRQSERLVHRARGLRTAVRGQVETHTGRLAGAGGSVTRAALRCLDVEQLRSDQRRRLLGAYDYQRQLERGYSVTRDATGAVLRSVEGLESGAALTTRLARGSVSSTVQDILTNDDRPEGTP